MSAPGNPPEFDDDVIDLLHHRWSARSARFQAMVSRRLTTAVSDGSAPSDGARPDSAAAS